MLVVPCDNVTEHDTTELSEDEIRGRVGLKSLENDGEAVMDLTNEVIPGQ